MDKLVVTWNEGDFTGDGAVDDDDFQLLQLNFGKQAESNPAVAAAFANASQQEEPDWWLEEGERDDFDESLVALPIADERID